MSVNNMCLYFTIVYHKFNKHVYKIYYCNTSFCPKMGKQIGMIQVSEDEINNNSA